MFIGPRIHVLCKNSINVLPEWWMWCSKRMIYLGHRYMERRTVDWNYKTVTGGTERRNGVCVLHGASR